MKEIFNYIHKRLEESEIYKDYSKEIQDLIDNKIISSGMTPKASLNVFLLNMSDTFKLFQNILKKEYLFDLRFSTETKFAENIIEKLKNITEFDYLYSGPFRTEEDNVVTSKTIEVLDRNHKTMIGVRFKQSIYDASTSYYHPYKLLSDCLKDVTLLQPIFDTPDINQPNCMIAYLELIEHLKTLDLPLTIIDHEIDFSKTNITNIFDCFLHLEESNWPEDEKAIGYAKSALYCHLFTRSSFKHFITEDFCTFYYKKIFFNIKILIKKDQNSKYKIRRKINDLICSKNEMFYRKVSVLKNILEWYYPIHLDDLIIDTICLTIGEIIGYDAFINEFFKILFYIGDCCSSGSSLILNLRSLRFEQIQDKLFGFKITHNDLVYCVNIKKELIDEIKQHFENLIPYDDIRFKDWKVCSLLHNFDDYSFILSRDEIDGGLEIAGNNTVILDFNTPIYKNSVLFEHSDEIKCYYNVKTRKLMVYVFDSSKVDLFSNIFINATSFSYIKYK